MNPKSNLKAYLIAAAGLTALIAGLLLFMLRTPPLPAEWRRVRPGMSREELLRVAPGHSADARSEKGFDVFTRKHQLLIRPCWWQMNVYYDDQGRVQEAWVYFTDPHCGLFNKYEHLCGEDAGTID